MDNEQIYNIISEYYMKYESVNRSDLIDLESYMKPRIESALHIEEIALNHPESILGRRYQKLMAIHPEMNQLKFENPFMFFKLMVYYNLSIFHKKHDIEFDFLEPFMKRYFEIENKYGSLFEVSKKIATKSFIKEKQKLNDLLNLDISKPIISKSIKNQTICFQEKKNSKSLVFDYHEITHEIEKAYSFNTRGFFNTHPRVSVHFYKKLGFSKTEIQESLKKDLGKTNYETDDICFFELLNHVQTPDLIPYIDFWHFLIDHDFENASQNSICNFSLNSDENDTPLFKKMREIYKIECQNYLDKGQDHIKMYLDW